MDERTLTSRREAVDEAMAALRKVVAELGDHPDASGRRRIGRAAQKAADARDLYDRTAEGMGVPPLPPLQRTRPAGPRPRSTDEAAITAAKRELTEVSARAAANDRNGGRRMGRGKQALQRADAQLRRSVQYGQQAEQVKARLRALGVPDLEIQETESAAWANSQSCVNSSQGDPDHG